ncbi:MAG: hypothetical protein BMS9Abin25_0839 [Gammaproteobacteria bacterium]|nr:MAG: hypothetical protein BMS9Abin25_0839 [Gammaproteobacteria bacterium]
MSACNSYYCILYMSALGRQQSIQATGFDLPFSFLVEGSSPVGVPSRRDCFWQRIAPRRRSYNVAFDVELIIPFRLAEKCRSGRGFRDMLSEGEARVSHPAGSIEHRREPEGQACGRFFFGSVSFVRTNEMNSPMKGEKHDSIQEMK